MSHEDHPDYYDKIQDPICLQAMVAKATNLQYTNISEVMSDLTLLRDNCVLYCFEDYPVLVASVSRLFLLTSLRLKQVEIEDGKEPLMPIPSLTSTSTHSTCTTHAITTAPPTLPNTTKATMNIENNNDSISKLPFSTSFTVCVRLGINDPFLVPWNDYIRSCTTTMKSYYPLETKCTKNIIRFQDGSEKTMKVRDVINRLSIYV